jgi:hypothetical protein
MEYIVKNYEIFSTQEEITKKFTGTQVSWSKRLSGPIKTLFYLPIPFQGKEWLLLIVTKTQKISQSYKLEKWTVVSWDTLYLSYEGALDWYLKNTIGSTTRDFSNVYKKILEIPKINPKDDWGIMRKTKREAMERTFFHKHGYPPRGSKYIKPDRQKSFKQHLKEFSSVVHKTNPSPAAKLHKVFTGRKVDNVTKININWPKELTKLGDTSKIFYKCKKVMDGNKVNHYKHSFKSPFPMLLASPDKKMLIIYRPSGIGINWRGILD